jgi:hypothetical protein
MSYVFRRSGTQLSSAALRWSSAATPCCRSRQLLQTSQNLSFSRSFRTTSRVYKELEEESARETNLRDQNAHEEEVKAGIEAATKQQIKRPWQREGADKPPTDLEAKKLNKTMTKGKNMLWTIL